MSFETFKSIVDKHGKFEVQFEGGEPTIHPEFIRMISYYFNHKECGRLIIQSNGMERFLLERYLIEKDFWNKLVFKISFNEYLYKLGKLTNVHNNIKKQSFIQFLNFKAKHSICD